MPGDTLDRSPKKNWVENSGGLPQYIERIAQHLHAKGMEIGYAIATAVNVVKKACASGDLNYPGIQHENAGSQAEACAAVSDWERKKAQARVSKGIHGRKITDEEFIKGLTDSYKSLSPAARVEMGARLLGMENMHRNTKGLEITDEEILEAEREIEKAFNPDDPDTDEFSAEFEISKVDGDKRLAFGWASIGQTPDGKLVSDRQGDEIHSADEIEKSAYDFVVDCRDSGEMHVRKGVGTMVESFVSTPEKCAAMGIPEGTLPTGWWVGFRVTDDEVWKSVKEGKYKMFSVHGRGKREEITDD